MSAVNVSECGKYRKTHILVSSTLKEPDDNILLARGQNEST